MYFLPLTSYYRFPGNLLCVSISLSVKKETNVCVTTKAGQLSRR